MVYRKKCFIVAVYVFSFVLFYSNQLQALNATSREFLYEGMTVQFVTVDLKDASIVIPDARAYLNRFGFSCGTEGVRGFDVPLLTLPEWHERVDSLIKINANWFNIDFPREIRDQSCTYTSGLAIATERLPGDPCQTAYTVCQGVESRTISSASRARPWKVNICRSRGTRVMRTRSMVTARTTSSE